jgi:Ca2+-binding RTX toxin-like protein
LVGVMVVLSAGVATAAVKYGSNGRDFFIGTNGEDTFYGKGSSDGLFGRGDDDVLYGNEGNDFIFGGSFRYDEIFDGRRMVPDGEDRLYGGSGDDCMFAGSSSIPERTFSMAVPVTTSSGPGMPLAASRTET